MAVTGLLQDFGTAGGGAEPVTLLSQSALEAQNLSNFEKGYSAGWEDALSMQIEEKSRLSKALSGNLEDLRFTYAEAYQQMLLAIVPVLDAMVSQVLPPLVRETLGVAVLHECRKMLEVNDASFVISVPPGCASAVRPVVGHALDVDVVIQEDPSLTDGQVAIKMGNLERELDIAAVLDGIGAAANGFAWELRGEESNA